MTEPDDDYIPDPDDFEEGPERIPGPLSQFPSPRHAVPALIAFAVFYIATVAYNRYQAGEYLWLSGRSIFEGHEYWRLFTSLCAHADLSHLLSNALIFLVFGWMLKAYFGLMVFPVASFAIGLITNLLTVSVYDPGIKLLGASGMAYGMVALWLVFYVRHDADHRVPMRIFRAVGFALVMMFPTTFEPQVSYLAHAIGFAIGLIAGFMLMSLVKVREPS